MARRNSQGTQNRGSGGGQRSGGSQSSSSPSLFTAALGIVGGLGVGAAAMYLLDPNQGERRRRVLAERASDTFHDAWDAVSEHAGEAGEKLAGVLPVAREKLIQQMDDAGETASEKAARARNAAREWIESARARLSNKASAMSPFERHRVAPAVVAATSTGLAALAIGVTAMYFCDPDRGRARRAWIGQKFTRTVNETGKFMRATGRHLANKGQGYYHQTRSAAEGAVDSAMSKFGGGSTTEGSAMEQPESSVPSI
jgi:gas vesicle protein